MHEKSEHNGGGSEADHAHERAMSWFLTSLEEEDERQLVKSFCDLVRQCVVDAKASDKSVLWLEVRAIFDQLGEDYMLSGEKADSFRQTVTGVVEKQVEAANYDSEELKEVLSNMIDGFGGQRNSSNGALFTAAPEHFQFAMLLDQIYLRLWGNDMLFEADIGSVLKTYLADNSAMNLGALESKYFGLVREGGFYFENREKLDKWVSTRMVNAFKAMEHEERMIFLAELVRLDRSYSQLAIIPMIELVIRRFDLQTGKEFGARVSNGSLVEIDNRGRQYGFGAERVDQGRRLGHFRRYWAWYMCAALLAGVVAFGSSESVREEVKDAWEKIERMIDSDPVDPGSEDDDDTYIKPMPIEEKDGRPELA